MKVFILQKSSTLTGLVVDTDMSIDPNMAATMSCENMLQYKTLLSL